MNTSEQLLTERDKQIIKDIERKPMERDLFARFYDIDIATAWRLMPYICICKDGMVRIREIGGF